MKILLAILFLILAAAVAYGGDSRIDGEVHDASTKKGIPGLTVKLIPPKGAPMPQKITFTNPEGRFQLLNLERGKYLLEVYQGVTLVHREVVTLETVLAKQIELTRK